MTEYRELVRLYHETVFRVAKGVLRDTSAAEDVTQDVFLGLLENPGPLARASIPRAYICRIALNRALDARRAAGRRTNHEARSPERRPEMDPVEGALRRELREKVAELPEELRQPLDLHYFQGLTLREAGVALELPEGTVSSRISGALQQLRAALAGAAFVAILASLDSELSLCAAEEAVPDGLSDRLLRIHPSRGPSTGRAKPAVPSRDVRRIATIGAVLLLALAAGIPATIWSVRRFRANAGGEFFSAGNSGAEAAASSPAGASANKERNKPGDLKDKPRSQPAEKPGELSLTGFLWASKEGPRLASGRYDLEDPLQSVEMQFPLPSVDSSVLLKAGDALAGVPVTGEASFRPFLEGKCGPEGAPQAYLTVELRFPANADFKFDAIDVGKVVAAEILPPAWLEAWREMVRGWLDLKEVCSKFEPGIPKRARVLELAGAISAARDRAQSSRAGLKRNSWKLQTECRALARVVELVEPFGLLDVLPKWPTSAGLLRLVMDASSPEALRLSAIDRWGKDILEVNVEFMEPSAATMPGGRDAGWTQIQMPLEHFCGLPQEQFAVYQARMRKGLESLRVKPDDKAVEELATILGATGMSARPLDDLDRQRLILNHGVRVCAVEAGSVAERCGFRAGDVIWTVIGPEEMFQGSNAVLKDLLNPTILGLLVESAQKQGLGLDLGVVRDEGAVKLTLKP